MGGRGSGGMGKKLSPKQMIDSIGVHAKWDSINRKVTLSISFQDEYGNYHSDRGLLKKSYITEFAKENGATDDQIKEIKRQLKGISMNKDMYVKR